MASSKTMLQSENFILRDGKSLVGFNQGSEHPQIGCFKQILLVINWRMEYEKPRVKPFKLVIGLNILVAWIRMMKEMKSNGQDVLEIRLSELDDELNIGK